MLTFYCKFKEMMVNYKTIAATAQKVWVPLLETSHLKTKVTTKAACSGNNKIISARHFFWDTWYISNKNHPLS